MKKVIEDANKLSSKKHLFRQGFFSGIGWAAGVTIGFAVISTLLVFLLSALGGLPLIGNWIASIVEVTTESLSKRTLLLPR